MTTKTKILIGILVIVILTGSGWWIWNQIRLTCNRKCRSLGYTSGDCAISSLIDVCGSNTVNIGYTPDCHPGLTEQAIACCCVR